MDFEFKGRYATPRVSNKLNFKSTPACGVKVTEELLECFIRSFHFTFKSPLIRQHTRYETEGCYCTNLDQILIKF